MRRPYPLQWPDGWKRALLRGTPKFESHFVQDRDAVIRRLARRGGSNTVITSNLPVGNKGQPYLGSYDGDSGIAVYWFEKRSGEERATERVLACDKWRKPEDNLRAIMKSLEALDGLDRWGASQVVDRATGFAALPPGSSGTIDVASVKRSWCEVFAIDADACRLAGMSNASIFAGVKAAFREAMDAHHPDRGGDTAIAAELNVALAEAEAELAR